MVYLIAVSPAMKTPHTVGTWLQKAPRVSYVILYTATVKIPEHLHKEAVTGSRFLGNI